MVGGLESCFVGKFPDQHQTRNEKAGVRRNVLWEQIIDELVRITHREMQTKSVYLRDKWFDRWSRYLQERHEINLLVEMNRRLKHE